VKEAVNVYEMELCSFHVCVNSIRKHTTPPI